jgi:hypothetical protein
LSLLKICNERFPLFWHVPSLLSSSDHYTLYSNCKYFCKKLWDLLSNPQPFKARQSSIQFILLLDTYIVQYILPNSRSEETIYLSQFAPPDKPSLPSVIHQVSHHEVTVNPYRTFTYFPISPDPTMTPDNSSQHSSTTHSQGTPTNSRKKTVMVEDSVEVISDLIREIQASDVVMEESTTPLVQPHIINQTKAPSSSIRFSLLKETFSSQSTSNINQLKQFFPCLSGNPSTTILSIRADNPASPLKLASQINELSLIGMKSLFKLNWNVSIHAQSAQRSKQEPRTHPRTQRRS